MNETTDVNPGQLPTPTPSPTHTITPTEDILISEILSVDSCIQISGDESGGYEWSGHTFYNGEIHQIIRRTTDGFYVQVNNVEYLFYDNKFHTKGSGGYTSVDCTFTHTPTPSVTITPTQTNTPTPYVGYVNFYNMKVVDDCSGGGFEIYISRDNGNNYTQLGSSINYSSNTTMPGGLSVPFLIRSHGTINTSVMVGDKVKIRHRALNLDGYSIIEENKTSCALEYTSCKTWIETGFSNGSSWTTESKLTQENTTNDYSEYIHTVSEGDNLNFCGVMSVVYLPTPTPSPTFTPSPTHTPTPPITINVYWTKNHSCASGVFQFKFNGSWWGTSSADVSGNATLVDNIKLLRSKEITIEDEIVIQAKLGGGTIAEGCPTATDRYVEVEKGYFDSNGDWVTESVVTQPFRGTISWSPYWFTYSSSDDGNVYFLCKMMHIVAS